jgi:hypothetical protein
MDDRDRRETTRFRLKRWVQLGVEGAGGAREISLLSRDVSAEGAFLLTGLQLPVGTPVRVKLSLEPTGADRVLELQVAATVVRSEPGGVAVRFLPGIPG